MIMAFSVYPKSNLYGILDSTKTQANCINFTYTNMN